MSATDKFYVGLDLMGFENNGIQRPISRVTLLLDDENVLTAGDDSGLELTADCPHATQAMVNALLAQLKGNQYKMYSATDTRLDPSAELGDGITADGVYSVISRIADDGMGFPSPSAPGKEELEDEFPAGGPMTQTFNRKIAETRSSISKTAEQIRLEVERVNNGLSELSASLTVELGKITSDIQDINGNYSKLEQTIDSFALTVDNGSTSSTIKLMANGVAISSQNLTFSGVATFKGLAEGTTTINGGCLKTGTIESMSINSSTIIGGTITGTAINGSTFNSKAVSGGAAASVTIEMGQIDFYYADQEQGAIRTNSLNGGFWIFTDYGFHVVLGNIEYLGINPSGIAFYQTSTELVTCYNNLDMQNYSILNTSDRRLKTNIELSHVNALSVINSMQTYSFDWLENGRHEQLGFIAQQLDEINPDFVSVNPADGHYSTKDMKIIPYLVKAVQELSAKFDNLEGDNL